MGTAKQYHNLYILWYLKTVDYVFSWSRALSIFILCGHSTTSQQSLYSKALISNIILWMCSDANNFFYFFFLSVHCDNRIRVLKKNFMNRKYYWRAMTINCLIGIWILFFRNKNSLYNKFTSSNSMGLSNVLKTSRNMFYRDLHGEA